MSYDWLKKPREAAGLSQRELAEAIGHSYEKMIQRLESCASDTPQVVRYEDLATALNVDPIALAEDHARDLTAAGEIVHAERARRAVERLRKEAEERRRIVEKRRTAERFPSIDPEPIQAALSACAEHGLVAAVAGRDRELTDASAQAKRIAQVLESGSLDDLVRMLNRPLQASIEGADGTRALKSLANFVRTIARACAATDPSLKKKATAGSEYSRQFPGETKAWAFALMIDQSCDLDSLRLVKLLPGNVPTFDDDSVAAVRSCPVTDTNVERRLYELVTAFADRLAFDAAKPSPDDEAAFKDYCDRVNNILWDRNWVNEHVFCLWEWANCEPNEVKERLLRCLPDLRLFECGGPASESSVLRVDRPKLETWIVSRLKAIAARLEVTQSSASSSHRAASDDSGETSAPKRSQNQFVFENNENVTVVQANDGSQAHQHNQEERRADK